MISQAAFQLASLQDESRVFLLAMLTIEEDTDPSKHPESSVNLVPLQYHDFLPLFTKRAANKLPPYRYVDHKIPVEAEERPPMGLMYSMSTTELQAIRKWIQETSPKALFVPVPHPVPHLFYLSRKKPDPSAFVLTTRPSTILQTKTSIHYHKLRKPLSRSEVRNTLPT